MLLTVKTRQKYLKYLGFYGGAIDGKVGPKTKLAYRALQERYFTRKEDIDGYYGKDTDILLRNAYNVEFYTKNFKLEEFRCKCKDKCTGYPVVLDVQFLKNLQALRDDFGSINITSGLRCKVHNAAVGGSATSRHTKGKAVDIKCAGCATDGGRRAVMNAWKLLPKFRYTYCNIDGNFPNMGNCVHVDVK